MTMMILDGDNLVNHKELNFFLKGNTSLDDILVKKPASWILDGGWKDM
jgi:dynein heavy chain